MAPATYVAEDGFMGHHLVKALCPIVGECQNREAGVGRLLIRRRGDGIGGFSEGK